MEQQTKQTEQKTYYNTIYDKAKEKLISYNDSLSNMKKKFEYEKLCAVYSDKLLQATYFLKKLDLIQKMPSCIPVTLSTAKDYLELFDSMKTYAQCQQDLSEQASKLFMLRQNMECIKTFVKDRPFLTGYEAEEFPKVISDLVNDYFDYSTRDLITKDLANLLLTQAIQTVSVDDMKTLIDAGLFDSFSLENISTSDKNIGNIKLLSDYLRQDVTTNKVITKLRGVTFKNEDGSNRQDYLEELQKACLHEKQDITIEPYQFKNSNGTEEPAAKVLWGDKCIGNLSADLIKTISQAYQNPVYSGKLVKVAGGGDNINFGCTLELTVTEKEQNPIDFSKYVEGLTPVQMAPDPTEPKMVEEQQKE